MRQLPPEGRGREGSTVGMSSIGRTLTQTPLETGWKGVKGPDAVWLWLWSPHSQARKLSFERDTPSHLSKENSISKIYKQLNIQNNKNSPIKKMGRRYK